MERNVEGVVYVKAVKYEEYTTVAYLQGIHIVTFSLLILVFRLQQYFNLNVFK